MYQVGTYLQLKLKFFTIIQSRETAQHKNLKLLHAEATATINFSLAGVWLLIEGGFYSF